MESIASFGSAAKLEKVDSPLARGMHSDVSLLEDSPVGDRGHDDTTCSGNTTLLDTDHDGSFAIHHTPSCYSSTRKHLRAFDSEMRKSRLKDTAHCLFSPPSRSMQQDERDVLAATAMNPTQGATPMPHTGICLPACLATHGCSFILRNCPLEHKYIACTHAMTSKASIHSDMLASRGTMVMSPSSDPRDTYAIDNNIV